MNWLNIEVKFLRSVDYLSCDPVERATWINLVAFCADHENGGTIKGCSGWGDRKWMQLVGVTLEEVSKPCGLWWVNPDDSISIAGYPLEQEKIVKRNRKNGKKGGRPSSKKPNDTKGDKPDGSVSVMPDGYDSLKRNSNSKGNNYSDEFESFWYAYPRKIGKGSAYKAWKRISGMPPVEEIIKAINAQRQSEQWKKDGGQFIPHPTTWLNAGRWEDEIISNTQSTTQEKPAIDPNISVEDFLNGK